MSVQLINLPLSGVSEIRGNPFFDHRGCFLNAFRLEDPIFRQVWGERSILQVNLSRTDIIGAIRGLHFQSGDHAEAKLVRCLRGRVWDVVVDLRKNSLTFGSWHALELCPGSGNALFIPEGCAHGFQVLEPESELLYLHSGCWIPHAETGICWNDPI